MSTERKKKAHFDLIMLN
uniref:Uncharacterized protein n=1 Tax=Arundo donax TaxID=35708 RepID=A0A0A9BVM6_ARUDO